MGSNYKVTYNVDLVFSIQNVYLSLFKLLLYFKNKEHKRHAPTEFPVICGFLRLFACS